ncbi:ABC transporter permease [Bacillus cereus group sp. N8]|uniref:Transport permease protein n=3 Tax=Bacillus TaxID=1386 RepID=A0ABV3IFA7_9BACI|nr:ABC transporter permease [Bacillus cereus group sp. N8]
MFKIYKVILSSLVVHMKQSLSRPTFRFIIILQPILYSILFYFMFKNSDVSNIGEYIVIGTGILNLWSSIIFSSAGDIERERYMGTLEIIYATPSDFRIIFLGKVLGNLLLGIFSMVLSFIFVTLVFKIDITIISPLAFFVSLFFTIISFTVISLLMAFLFTLSRSSRMLMNSMEYPIYILCGIIFPISILPKYVQYISFVLSPTWGVKLLRQSMTGITNYSDFYIDLSVLLILTAIYLFLVIVLFRKIDYRTRMKGNLGAH